MTLQTGVFAILFAAVVVLLNGCGDGGQSPKDKSTRGAPDPIESRGKADEEVLARVERARREKSRFLDLKDLVVSDDDLAAVARQLPDLRQLSIGENTMTDRGADHLSKLKKLQSLVLGEAGLTDAGLAHLAALSQLEHLNVTGAKFTDDGLDHLAELQNLRQLRLGGEDISNQGAAALKELRGLEWLILVGTQIDDGAMLHFRDMTHLDTLYLFCPKISAAALEKLQDELRGRVHVHW